MQNMFTKSIQKVYKKVQEVCSQTFVKVTFQQRFLTEKQTPRDAQGQKKTGISYYENKNKKLNNF